MPETRPRRYFRRRHRLTHAREFQAVYRARACRHRGPITVFAIPNDLGHCRLGLSVGRRVGGAVVRNRIKRRLREAFRLIEAELDLGGDGERCGYDCVVVVRPHPPRGTTDYAQRLGGALEALHRAWTNEPPTTGTPSHG